MRRFLCGLLTNGIFFGILYVAYHSTKEEAI